jgi:hypothetical protein
LAFAGDFAFVVLSRLSVVRQPLQAEELAAASIDATNTPDA